MSDPRGSAESRGRPAVDDHPNSGPHTECLVDHGGKGVRRHCRRGCKWPCPDASIDPRPASAATECGDECCHVMLLRCPWCRTEMYAPAVWAFSHGTARCACGFKPDPKVKP